jgi:hypothetical protein
LKAKQKPTHSFVTQHLQKQATLPNWHKHERHHTMTRHLVHDIIQNTSEPKGFTVGDYLAERAALDADADADPNDNNQMSVEEHEAAARALADANQKEEAIQSWHRSAIGHSKAGNHAGVVAAILKAERLAGHNAFAPALARKGTAADAVQGDGEVLGDDDGNTTGNTATDGETIDDENDEDQAQPTATASAPDAADGEIIGSDSDEDASDEG